MRIYFFLLALLLLAACTTTVPKESYFQEENNVLALYLTEEPRDASFHLDEQAAQDWIDVTMSEIIEWNGITDLDPSVLSVSINREAHEKICLIHIELNQMMIELDDETLINHWTYLNQL